MPQSVRCPDAERWQDLLKGALSEAEQTELKAHLETCVSCQHQLEGVAADRESWIDVAGHLATPLPAPEAALQFAIAQLKAETHEADVEAGSPMDHALPPDFLAPSEDPQCLGRLGEYEVSEVIGRGGMGIVLKAFDPALRRTVAIKVMAPHLAGSAAARKRFAREGQAAALIHHDNIVSIYAVSEARGLPYLVMEYVPGTSVEERLRRSGPLELEEILHIGAKVAEGLDAAHMRGLVHRDIKPGNILLGGGWRVEGGGNASSFAPPHDPTVKIADFGLARVVNDPRMTQSGLLVGTPQYMAPEQTRGEPPDHRADLFSLGSVLYAMCTGRPPFQADNMMAVLRRISDDAQRPVREINPAVPEWLAEVIDQLHRKDPAERFQSAGEVAGLLRQGLAHLQHPAQVDAPHFTARGLRARPEGGKAMLVPCEECGKQISDRAYTCPHCGLRRMCGYEYRSQFTILGLPLVHVAFGQDLATGRRRVAKGIIAVGDRAYGVLAVGTSAVGVLAIGAFSLGLIAVGALALGPLLALGGMAVGGMAIGGMAAGPIAIGGMAVGYYALGGGVGGMHGYGGNIQDPQALEFFRHIFGGRVGLPN
jgi:serine/threonine-protein kinase